MTLAAGVASSDPGLSRLYYAKDGSSLTFTRPLNILDAARNNLTSNFDYYLGVWGVSKQPGDTSSALTGTRSVSSARPWG